MSLIADTESALRLPVPVLRQPLLSSLPLPSLPVKHCRHEENDEQEQETFVSFKRRASITNAEQHARYFITRSNLDSLCYGPVYDSLAPYHRPVDISSRENSAELEGNTEDNPDCCSSCASSYWKHHPAAQLAQDKAEHTQYPKCCVTCAASYWQHHKPWELDTRK